MFDENFDRNESEVVNDVMDVAKENPKLSLSAFLGYANKYVVEMKEQLRDGILAGKLSDNVSWLASIEKELNLMNLYANSSNFATQDSTKEFMKELEEFFDDYYKANKGHYEVDEVPSGEINELGEENLYPIYNPKWIQQNNNPYLTNLRLLFFQIDKANKNYLSSFANSDFTYTVANDEEPLPESKDADEEDIQMDLAEKEVQDFQNNVQGNVKPIEEETYLEEIEAPKNQKPIPSIDEFLDWVYERGKYEIGENLTDEERKRQEARATSFPFSVDIFKDKTQVKTLFGKEIGRETWMNYARRNLMRKSLPELQDILKRIQAKNERLKKEIEQLQKARTDKEISQSMAENSSLNAFKEKEKIPVNTTNYDAMEQLRKEHNLEKGVKNENLNDEDLQKTQNNNQSESAEENVKNNIRKHNR